MTFKNQRIQCVSKEKQKSCPYIAGELMQKTIPQMCVITNTRFDNMNKILDSNITHAIVDVTGSDYITFVLDTEVEKSEAHGDKFFIGKTSEFGAKINAIVINSDFVDDVKEYANEKLGEVRDAEEEDGTSEEDSELNDKDRQIIEFVDYLKELLEDDAIDLLVEKYEELMN